MKILISLTEDLFALMMSQMNFENITINNPKIASGSG